MSAEDDGWLFIQCTVVDLVQGPGDGTSTALSGFCRGTLSS